MEIDFIAEVSSNHSKDLSRTLAFIDASAEIGCSTVKFQLFRVDELFAPEVLSRSKVLQSRREWELPLSMLDPIASRCNERGIRFMCTPFFSKCGRRTRELRGCLQDRVLRAFVGRLAKSSC